MNQFRSQQGDFQENENRNTIIMHYSSNLSYQCCAFSRFKKCYNQLYMQSYTMKAIISHRSGRPIQWPIHSVTDVISQLNQLITQMNESRFIFSVNNRSISIIFKNNRLIKKEEPRSEENIQNYMIDCLSNACSNTFQQQIQQFQQQQLQIFKNLIQQISNRIQIQMYSVGIINKLSFNYSNMQQKSFSKALPILMTAKSLELNGNIANIINDKYNVQLSNICEQNMTVELKYRQKNTLSRRNRKIGHQNFNTINNQQKQRNQKLNEKIRTYIQNLMRKLKFRPDQNFEQQEQQEQSQQDNKMIDIDNANHEVNTNIYEIVQLKQGQSYLQIIGGVSTVSRMQVKSIRYVIKSEVPQQDEQEQIDNIYMGKKVFRLTNNKQHLHNNKLRFRRQLDIVRQINKRSKGKRFYLVDYYYYPYNLDVYYMTWHELTLQVYLDLYHDKMGIEEIVQLCIQLVLMVMDLHSMGVIHRDLKPSNILVDIYGPVVKLKLIDFTDSIIKGSQQIKKIMKGELTIYSTPLFCPLETSVSSKEHKTKGIANQTIDRWSIGVLIYQILHNKLPLSYSQNSAKDIHHLWQDQFLQILNLRPQTNIAKVNRILELITFNLLRMKQESRMQLDKVLSLLLVAAVYVQDIKQMAAQACRFGGSTQTNTI